MFTYLGDQEILYILYSGLALGVLIAFSALTQVLSRRENRYEAKSRRLRMIAKGTSTEELLAVLKPAPKTGFFSRVPLIGDLQKTLLRAGFSIGPTTFMFMCCMAFMLALVTSMTFFAIPESFAIAAGVSFGLPLLFIHQKAQEQIEALIQQLPDALELMARGLRVGHPLNTSIGSVAEEMQDPIGTEFGIVYDQVKFGEDLSDAMQDFSDRVDLEDVRYLAASIGIQHGTGGDLAEIVQTLATVIRNRIAMRRKVKAVSAEGRLTAWFLSALPLIIFGYTSVTTPEYFGSVSNDPLFIPMLTCIAALLVANFLVLRKLVTFRI